MSVEFNNLLNSFEQAIKRKEKGKFGKEDVDAIYKAASKAFDTEHDLNPQQINQIRDKWVTLAGEHIDKGRAQKKLHGTSRAEAIRSVLQNML